VPTPQYKRLYAKSRSAKGSEGHALEMARLDKSLQKELLKFCLLHNWGQQRDRVVSISELRKHIAQNVMLVSHPLNDAQHLSYARYRRTLARIVAILGMRQSVTGSPQLRMPRQLTS
jgi:hypothetical protein